VTRLATGKHVGLRGCSGDAVDAAGSSLLVIALIMAICRRSEIGTPGTPGVLAISDLLGRLVCRDLLQTDIFRMPVYTRVYRIRGREMHLMI